jgi:hypothetical protein
LAASSTRGLYTERNGVHYYGGDELHDEQHEKLARANVVVTRLAHPTPKRSRPDGENQEFY